MSGIVFGRWVPLLMIGLSPVVQRAIAQHETTKPPEPIPTTLCEVVEHPSRFNGKLIRLRASFESDGLEHSILEQPGCEKGIVPFPPSDNKPRPSIDAFDRALDEGQKGTLDKTVTATFIGRFIWKPPSKRTLVLESVTDLQVTRTAEKSREPQ